MQMLHFLKKIVYFCGISGSMCWQYHSFITKNDDTLFCLKKMAVTLVLERYGFVNAVIVFAALILI